MINNPPQELSMHVNCDVEHHPRMFTCGVFNEDCFLPAFTWELDGPGMEIWALSVIHMGIFERLDTISPYETNNSWAGPLSFFPHKLPLPSLPLT